MIALATAVGLSVLYLLWLIVRNYWPLLLLVTHLILGLLLLVSVLFTLYAGPRTGPTESILYLAGQASAQAKTSRIRLGATKLLGALQAITGGWPTALYGIFAGFFRSNALSLSQASARASLQGHAHRSPPITLALVIAVYAATWLQPSAMYWTKLLIIIIGINIVARHLTYAIHPQPLPMQLRRTTGNAYLTFAVIAISDICTIILIFNAIDNWQDDNLFNLSDLKAVLTLVFFGHLTELFKKVLEGITPSTHDVLLPSVGALFSYNLLETAYKFREFKRTDEDHLSIAGAYSLIGKYNDALATLAEVKDKTGSWHFQRAIAHLGVLQPDSAWYDVEQSLRARRTDVAHQGITDGEVFVEGLGLLILDLPKDARSAWIRKGVEHGLPDIFIAYALSLVSFSGQPVPASKYLYSSPEIQAKYPLSQIADRIFAPDFAAAKTQLEQLVPTSVEEKLFHSILVLQAHLFNKETSREEDTVYFSQWSAQNLDTFSHVDWSKMTKADLVVAMGSVYFIYLFARGFESPYEQSWLYILNEIKKLLPFDVSMNLFFDKVTNFVTR